MGATESKNPVQTIAGPVILPGDERIRVSSKVKDPSKLICGDEKGQGSVASLLEKGMEIAKDKPCLGTRKSANDAYEWMTYAEVDDQSKKIGCALRAKLDKSAYVAIRCKNRPEWTIFALGCAQYSMTICTINYTTDYDTVKKIINQAAFKIFVCSSEADAKWILNNHSEMPSIQFLVVMDSKNDELSKLAEQAGIELFDYNQFLELGSNNIREIDPGTAEDIFTVCYTSGTTGDPKGVMLNHKTFVSQVYSLGSSFKLELDTLSTISYLPVAHVFEICCELYVISNGGTVGFYRGDIRGLMNDIETLQPTCFPVVPRLLNRIYSEVMNEVNSSSWKKYMMNWALKSKSDAIKAGGGSTIWDTVLFPKIRNKLGGNIKVLLVASAPISSDVKAFFKCALDCLLFEAYGQTETGAVTLTDPNDWAAGHVGFPQAHCQIKVIDVPEMNYFAKDDVGEICVKGPSTMVGYHNREDLTAEVKDAQGWVHTGDIGHWLPSGALSIIDRRKNIFKLSQGEYIAPEKVENSYSRCSLVAQIFVDGISTENYCVAIVVPDTKVFVKWTKSIGIEETDPQKLCQNQTVIESFIKELHKEGKKDSLNSLEQVKKIILLTKPFTMEDGLLTATLKNKRVALRKHFESDIKALYEENK